MFFNQVVLGGASGKAWGGCAYIISLLLGVGGGEMTKSEMTKIHNAPAGYRTRGPTMATLDLTTKPLALDLYKDNVYLYTELLPYSLSNIPILRFNPWTSCF